MLKTESVTARRIEDLALLLDGNILIDKVYSPTDDKFVLHFMRTEDVRESALIRQQMLGVSEERAEELDAMLCDIWVNKSTMIVVKPDEKFQVVPTLGEEF